jgi:hypothetical protein
MYGLVWFWSGSQTVGSLTSGHARRRRRGGTHAPRLPMLLAGGHPPFRLDLTGAGSGPSGGHLRGAIRHGSGPSRSSAPAGHLPCGWDGAGDDEHSRSVRWGQRHVVGPAQDGVGLG